MLSFHIKFVQTTVKKYAPNLSIRGYKTKAVTKCNTTASTLTETSILYTDGHMHTQTHGRTDRLIPAYP